MIRQLYLPILLALAGALLVQSLEAYKSDVPQRRVRPRAMAMAMQQPIEPPEDCTGECADGYRWARENAINDESRCNVGTRAFRVGCANLVQDEILDRF